MELGLAWRVSRGFNLTSVLYMYFQCKDLTNFLYVRKLTDTVKQQHIKHFKSPGQQTWWWMTHTQTVSSWVIKWINFKVIVAIFFFRSSHLWLTWWHQDQDQDHLLNVISITPEFQCVTSDHCPQYISFHLWPEATPYQRSADTGSAAALLCFTAPSPLAAVLLWHPWWSEGAEWHPVICMTKCVCLLLYPSFGYHLTLITSSRIWKM